MPDADDPVDYGEDEVEDTFMPDSQSQSQSASIVTITSAAGSQDITGGPLDIVLSPASHDAPSHASPSPPPVSQLPPPTNARSLVRQTSASFASRVADGEDDHAPSAPATRGRASTRGRGARGASSAKAAGGRGKGRAKATASVPGGGGGGSGVADAEPIADPALVLRVTDLQAKFDSTVKSHTQSLALLQDWKAVFERDQAALRALPDEFRDLRRDMESHQQSTTARLSDHARGINRALGHRDPLQASLEAQSAELANLRAGYDALRQEHAHLMFDTRRRLDAMAQQNAIEPILPDSNANVTAATKRARAAADAGPPTRPAPSRPQERVVRAARAHARVPARARARLDAAPVSTSSDTMHDVRYGPVPPAFLYDVHRFVRDVMDAAEMPYAVHVAAEFAHEPERNWVRIRLRTRSSVHHLLGAIGMGKVVEGTMNAEAELCDSALDPAVGPSTIRLCSWNMNGYLSLKLDSEDRSIFLSLLTANDVLFLNETFLGPDEDRSLKLPAGYTILSQCRPWRPNYRIPHGGVAAIVRSTVPFRVVQAACGPDLLTLELGDVVVVAAYLLPENKSHWTQWSDVNPVDRLYDALFHCSTVMDKPIILLGDLNARTRSQQTASCRLPRNSPDGVLSPRGRWLLQTAEDFSLGIVNGTTIECASGTGSLTSLQGENRGSSVVDYLLLSHSLVDRCSSFVISRPHSTADHCALSMVLSVDSHPSSSPASASGKPLCHRGAAKEKVDVILHNLLEKPQLSFADALAALYGPVLTTSGGTEVRLACSIDVPLKVGAGCCMWNVDRFHTYRVQTSSLMEIALFGLRFILMQARPHCPLQVFTSVVDLVQLLCYNIVPIAREGWNTCHRGILQDICALIGARRGSLQLVLVRESHVANVFHVSLARSRAALSLDSETPTSFATTPSVQGLLEVWRGAPMMCGPTLPPVYSKVFSRVPRRVPLPKKPAVVNTSSSDVDPGSTGHRARAHVRRIMTDKLNLLLNCVDPGQWWRMMKALDTDRRAGLPFSLDDLAEIFARRMNPPQSLPPQFNASAFAADCLFNNLLPPDTSDVTPDLDFTRPFTIGEIDDAKRHLRAHSLNTAKGVDGVSYARILAFESEDLADLFNTCIATRSCPTEWLVTKLIGIPKKGKPPNDPESYRIIALECCLLKFLTLLSVTRLRAWITATAMLPDSQNGFRPGMRTENCPFVLRTAIDKTRADSEVLYVAFMDLTNAFPSTNRPTLWRILYDNDARGPIVDWLRMIYDRMEYVVNDGVHSDLFSEQFKSLWGILAGDSGSPDLFNVYMASFLPPILDCHVRLADRAVCNVEQADDICMWTRTASGLQLLVHYCVLVWCALSFLIANAAKSCYMIFGPLPRYLTPLSTADADLSLVKSFTYVGVTFQSTARDIFALHYHKKDVAAGHVAMMIFKKEGAFGTLDPPSLMRLYMTQVDPHLTFGCEVVVDVSNVHLRGLESRQLSYLRRALGLHKHSSQPLLFFLTGIMPVRHRRLVLQLRYLEYLVNQADNVSVSCAFEENIRLCHRMSSCWLGDLLVSLRRLLPDLAVPALDAVDSQWINATSASVRTACFRHINSEVNANATIPLLHRPELPMERPIRLLPFLSAVHIPAHRRALTLLVTGCHKLYVAVGRQRGVPRAQRLCRACDDRVVEDECHVLFYCLSHPTFALLRNDFFERMISHSQFTSPGTDFDNLGAPMFVRRIIFGSDVEAQRALARMACRIYSVFVRELAPAPPLGNSAEVPD